MVRALKDAMEIRDVTTHAEFRAVRDLEVVIWGPDSADDAVGVALMAASIKRGGILLGAFDGARLAGFAFAFPGLKDGLVLQWSHMLGVDDVYRGTGLGRQLKLEQRRRALAMGVGRMEWTFDPLQAANAHLNLHLLGATVGEYLLDVYGPSASTLHRGAPTDRFVAEWQMDAPRVVTLAECPRAETRHTTPPFDATAMPAAVTRIVSGGWDEPAGVALGLSDVAVGVAIPRRFSEMLREEPALALAWRLATRDVFRHYLGRGYRADGFCRASCTYRLGCYRSAVGTPSAP